MLSILLPLWILNRFRSCVTPFQHCFACIFLFSSSYYFILICCLVSLHVFRQGAFSVLQFVMCLHKKGCLTLEGAFRKKGTFFATYSH
jgi:hypothetical protein